MKHGKRFKEFKKLLDQSYDYLKERNFDAALSLYHYLDSKYNQLAEKDKTPYIKNSIDYLRKELILYLKITELTKDFEKIPEHELKKKLEHVYFLINEILINHPESKPLIEYAIEIYHKMSNLCKKYIYERKFKRLLEEINILKDTNLDEAYNKYNHLIECYKELTKAGYDYELLSVLRELLREMRLKELERLAYAKIKKTALNLKFNKIQVPVEYRTIKPIETQEFNKSFTEIHHLLRKNELKKATELYQNL
jgi:hypothetical protein